MDEIPYDILIRIFQSIGENFTSLACVNKRLYQISNSGFFEDKRKYYQGKKKFIKEFNNKNVFEFENCDNQVEFLEKCKIYDITLCCSMYPYSQKYPEYHREGKVLSFSSLYNYNPRLVYWPSVQISNNNEELKLMEVNNHYNYDMDIRIQL